MQGSKLMPLKMVYLYLTKKEDDLYWTGPTPLCLLCHTVYWQSTYHGQLVYK